VSFSLCPERARILASALGSRLPEFPRASITCAKIVISPYRINDRLCKSRQPSRALYQKEHPSEVKIGFEPYQRVKRYVKACIAFGRPIVRFALRQLCRRYPPGGGGPSYAQIVEAIRPLGYSSTTVDHQQHMGLRGDMNLGLEKWSGAPKAGRRRRPPQCMLPHPARSRRRCQSWKWPGLPSSTCNAKQYTSPNATLCHVKP